jgi:hypothetical protein
MEICRFKEGGSSIEMGETHNMTKIHSFLGLTGYTRRFIEGLSMIATPLT